MQPHLLDRGNYNILVVGGGIMGVSTALALRREWPNATIAIFEGEDTKTASKGMSRIIRTPYMQKEYVELAEQAKQQWDQSTDLQAYYRNCGWVQEVDQHSYKPFHKRESPVTPAEVKDLVGSFKAPLIRSGKALWLNKEIGVADANHAVEVAAAAAAKAGVVRVAKNVSSLAIKQDTCHGAWYDDGVLVTGEKIIVAAGAWTPGLLHRSGVRIPDDFFEVTATAVGTLDLLDDEYERLRDMPILSTDDGEIMPPNPQTRNMQVTSTAYFTIDDPNTLELEDQSRRGAKNQQLLERMLPDMAGRRLDVKLFPELIARGRHPLVDRVPDLKGIYLAVGGSYHCYKFLPVFGDQVVRYLKGNEAELSAQWSWHR